jgi:hypothetical protein
MNSPDAHSKGSLIYQGTFPQLSQSQKSSSVNEDEHDLNDSEGPNEKQESIYVTLLDGKQPLVAGSKQLLSTIPRCYLLCTGK